MLADCAPHLQELFAYYKPKSNTENDDDDDVDDGGHGRGGDGVGCTSHQWQGCPNAKTFMLLVSHVVVCAPTPTCVWLFLARIHMKFYRMHRCSPSKITKICGPGMPTLIHISQQGVAWAGSCTNNGQGVVSVWKCISCTKQQQFCVLQSSRYT